MREQDYHSVLNDMRLSTGELFPIPITLDVSREFSQNLSIGEKIILREKEGFKVALMSIESIWEPDFEEEACSVYGTKDKSHPGSKLLI